MPKSKNMMTLLPKLSEFDRNIIHYARWYNGRQYPPPNIALANRQQVLADLHFINSDQLGWVDKSRRSIKKLIRLIEKEES